MLLHGCPYTETVTTEALVIDSAKQRACCSALISRGCDRGKPPEKMKRRPGDGEQRAR